MLWHQLEETSQRDSALAFILKKMHYRSRFPVTVKQWNGVGSNTHAYTHTIVHTNTLINSRHICWSPAIANIHSLSSTRGYNMARMLKAKFSGTQNKHAIRNRYSYHAILSAAKWMQFHDFTSHSFLNLASQPTSLSPRYYCLNNSIQAQSVFLSKSLRILLNFLHSFLSLFITETRQIPYLQLLSTYNYFISAFLQYTNKLPTIYVAERRPRKEGAQIGRYRVLCCIDAVSLGT